MNTPEREIPNYNDSLPGSELPPDAAAPPVVMWYRVYCVLMIVLYIAGLSVGAAIVLFHSDVLAQISKSGQDLNGVELAARGIIFMLTCLVMFVLNVTALFLPRRAWAWVYHLVNIALGLTGCCFVITIPLLVFWLKPETQHYFGRDTSSTPPPAGGAPPLPSV